MRQCISVVSPVIQLREVTGHAPLRDSRQLLQQTERLLKQLQQKSLKLPRDAILHQQLIHTVHGQRAEIPSVLSRVRDAVAAEASKVEDGVENGRGDHVGERHPAEKVG